MRAACDVDDASESLGLHAWYDRLGAQHRRAHVDCHRLVEILHAGVVESRHAADCGIVDERAYGIVEEHVTKRVLRRLHTIEIHLDPAIPEIGLDLRRCVVEIDNGPAVGQQPRRNGTPDTATGAGYECSLHARILITRAFAVNVRRER